MSVDPNSSEPVDVMLFMPEETFDEIHGQAVRLGVTDAALVTASWHAARADLERDQTVPRLRSGSTGAVYVAIAPAVRDDALAFAKDHDRSMSWAFLKAWALVRARVAALLDKEQLARWI